MNDFVKLRTLGIRVWPRWRGLARESLSLTHSSAVRVRSHAWTRLSQVCKSCGWAFIAMRTSRRGESCSVRIACTAWPRRNPFSFTKECVTTSRLIPLRGRRKIAPGPFSIRWCANHSGVTTWYGLSGIVTCAAVDDAAVTQNVWSLDGCDVAPDLFKCALMSVGSFPSRRSCVGHV